MVLKHFLPHKYTPLSRCTSNQLSKICNTQGIGKDMGRTLDGRWIDGRRSVESDDGGKSNLGLSSTNRLQSWMEPWRVQRGCTRLQFRELAIYPGLLSLSDESNSSAHCWDVLKVNTVFLSGLQVSPLLLFSAPILAGK